MGAPATRWAIRGLLTVASVSLFAATLRKADLRGVASLIVSTPALWAVVLPAALGTLADAEAWRRLAAGCGTRVSLARLVRTRLSAEAVAVSLPWGAVFAEGTALYLLTTRAGLAREQVLAALASRRFYVTFAHGVMLGAAGLTGLAILGPGAGAALDGRLAWIALGASLTLVIFAMLAPRFLLLGPAARRFPGFSMSLSRSGTPGRAPFSVVTAFCAFLWLTESLETFVILRLLGSNLTFPQVFSFDALVALLRSLAIFSPAGLGFQDAGYMAFLVPSGGPTLAAAFILIKRGREMLFAAIGYLLLAVGDGAAVTDRAAAMAGSAS
jgi:uncharacterized membrane protein YbhN (UPF0104 family)